MEKQRVNEKKRFVRKKKKIKMYKHHLSALWIIKSGFLT